MNETHLVPADQGLVHKEMLVGEHQQLTGVIEVDVVQPLEIGDDLQGIKIGVIVPDDQANAVFHAVFQHGFQQRGAFLGGRGDPEIVAAELGEQLLSPGKLQFGVVKKHDLVGHIVEERLDHIRRDKAGKEGGQKQPVV